MTMNVYFLACRSRNGTCYDIGETWDEREPGICVKYQCVKHKDGHKSDIVAQSEYLMFTKSNKYAMTRNCSNLNPNPALKTKTRNELKLLIGIMIKSIISSK